MLVARVTPGKNASPSTARGMRVNSATGGVTIGGLPWLDYVLASPRRAARLAKEHKENYLSTESMAWFPYQPLLSGMRRAVNAVDPRAELDEVVAWGEMKQDWRAAAYRDSASGFLELLPRRATGVPVVRPVWSEGDLSVVFRSVVGLRLRDDSLMLVAPYVKKAELDRDAAEVVLFIMESVMDQALPGAVPVVWDTRRGKAFKLTKRTNRRNLEVAARGLAAKYLCEWSLVA